MVKLKTGILMLLVGLLVIGSMVSSVSALGCCCDINCSGPSCSANLGCSCGISIGLGVCVGLGIDLPMGGCCCGINVGCDLASCSVSCGCGSSC